MAARNVTESTVTMIRSHIKANIAAALAAVRVERADQKVTTEPPQDYFVYERAHGFKTPCVFIIVSNGDLMKSRGPNSIMATLRVNISVVVEDRDQDRLSLKAWRYQDALFEVLDNTQIVSSGGDVKLTVVPQSFSYSPSFTADNDPKSSTNTFRKEVLVECDVHHFEQP